MTIVVEDGTGLSTAESYVSVQACGTYASNRGLTFPSDATAEQALRRATAYVDQTYRLRFQGYRTNRRAQALEWPRAMAYYKAADVGGDSPFFVDPRAWYPFDLIPSNQIPIEVINATCEAAIREATQPGVLFPDLERGGDIHIVKAGSVSVQYGPGASASTTFQAIEAALSALIGPRSTYTARASRG